MEFKKKRRLKLCFAKLRYMISPVQSFRMKKMTRKIINMKQFKLTIWSLGFSSCFIFVALMYYWHHSSLTKQYHDQCSLVKTTTTTEKYFDGTPMRHIPLSEIYQDIWHHGTEVIDSFELEDRLEAQMLNTQGCTIPLAMVNYENNAFSTKKDKMRKNCGKRAIYLKRVNAEKIKVTIKNRVITKYFLQEGTQFYCCYRYAPCRKLNSDDDIILKADFINIKCYELTKRNFSRVIYDDVYAFCKKVKLSKKLQTQCKERYNVLMLGMDSMSLSRIVQTMPRTVNYLKDNFWIGLRGYHKVGDNSFPNLMAAFTGKNLSTITKQCSRRMDQCNKFFIWKIFKDAGYVTAYGEDYLRLPDTFSRENTFREAPTHHYIRPFFLRGEFESHDKSLVCAGKLPSGVQLLDYAFDFAYAYREDNFFGIFWMNSFSHNENSKTQDADKIFENFFSKLTYTGILENTFIIFFSDHGIRFGENRLKVESFYDDRMPFLFMSLPVIFKSRHSLKFRSVVINEFRLITPYDLFNTLVDINHLSKCSNSTSVANVSEACPKCQSLFGVVSANRTCQDVAIHNKWCSCYKLYPLDIHDTEGVNGVLYVVSHIKSMKDSIKTKRCWGCMSLSLKSIIRVHFFYDKTKINLYFVVAFVMSPGNVTYEATVLKKGEKLQLVGPVSVISPYRGLGDCATLPNDRLFCVCQKVDNCKK